MANKFWFIRMATLTWQTVRMQLLLENVQRVQKSTLDIDPEVIPIIFSFEPQWQDFVLRKAGPWDSSFLLIDRMLRALLLRNSF